MSDSAKIFIGVGVAAIVVAGAWLKYRVISDCGALGLLKNAELVWLFGGCSP